MTVEECCGDSSVLQRVFNSLSPAEIFTAYTKTTQQSTGKTETDLKVALNTPLYSAEQPPSPGSIKNSSRECSL